MQDILDKILALKKQCTFSNSIKITQNNVLLFFSYFIKLYEYWGKLQSSHETKQSSMEKIMRLMLEEVIMSDGQMYSFLQLFFNTEKISLNRRFG